MGVLSGKEIKRRANEIFESDYHETCVDVAAYNLRLNDKNMMINGVKYDEDNPYEYNENEGFVKLPPRRISVLSTIEKFKLSNDLCARIGITFSWSKRGLIPLFGPQVDPGYNDYFYAIVYNPNGKDIKLKKGERLFKMELHTVEGDTEINYFSYGFPDIDPDMTKEDSIRDLSGKMEKTAEKVDKLSKGVEKNNTRIVEVAGGYRNVVWFGIFLISASIFGVILSFLLSSANYTKLASLMGGQWLPLTVVIIIALFIVGWILTVIAVIKGMFSKEGSRNG